MCSSCPSHPDRKRLRTLNADDCSQKASPGAGNYNIYTFSEFNMSDGERIWNEESSDHLMSFCRNVWTQFCVLLPIKWPHAAVTSCLMNSLDLMFSIWSHLLPNHICIFCFRRSFPPSANYDNVSLRGLSSANKHIGWSYLPPVSSLWFGWSHPQHWRVYKEPGIFTSLAHIQKRTCDCKHCTYVHDKGQDLSPVKNHCDCVTFLEPYSKE